MIALLALALRFAGKSGPYYVDAARHIRSIESGRLIIHAPCYFLFNATGFFLSHLLHVSAADALQVLNIGFSVAGAVVFYLLVSRSAMVPSPFWISLAYICSPIVWFAADVHSTYAAMTFFAPLLLLLMECERSLIWAWAIWAILTGFRPSDGVFVLPWMFFHSFRFPWRRQLVGVSVATALVAAWWVPTARRAYGNLMSPLLYSGSQAHELAQGVLSGHLGLHALVNLFHAAAGTVMTWGVLTPFLCLGMMALRRNPLVRSMSIFLAPGLAFLFLYFISDGLYLAYAAAAGFVLAGIYLARWPPKKRRVAYSFALGASMLFMCCARTANGKNSRTRAVADAYFLKYSVPSLKGQRDPRLASLLGKCKDNAVLGVCKE